MEFQGVGVRNVQRGERGLAVGVHERGVLVLGRMVAFFAVRADGTRQPLGQYAEQGVGEMERVDLHLQQARDRLDRAVGMQRAEHEVAGQ